VKIRPDVLRKLSPVDLGGPTANVICPILPDDRLALISSGKAIFATAGRICELTQAIAANWYAMRAAQAWYWQVAGIVGLAPLLAK